MRTSFRQPQASVTVDCVVFGSDDEGLKVLLIERGVAPFKGAWALPGGFVLGNESLDEAARRELREETGATSVYLEQLYTFGEPLRDPRGRVVTVAYYALVKLSDHRVLQATTDARAAAWVPIGKLPRLAFDHREIFQAALRRLQAKVRYQPIGFELLPREFTLSQLQRLYETVLERTLDKRNFRKKILAMDLLIETERMQLGVAHRAARLYQFDQRKYKALESKGFNFEL
jgi:8-oxo-dGTP diphosphatase